MAARADPDREPRAERWPAGLLLAGAATLLPWQAARNGAALLEDALLTLRGFVDPRARRGGESAAAAAPPAPEAAVHDLLSRARAAVLPPRAAGWERDGRFCAVPVGRSRSPASVALAVPGPVPPEEPVFRGRELLGFTPAWNGGAPRLVPLTARGTRLPACAGEPGRREARFLALGDGSGLLRVAFVDGEIALAEGDLAWAVDPPTPPGGAVVRRVGGAWIGRLVRDPRAEGGTHGEWSVAPFSAPETLAEVAIRHPPGFPAPAELLLVPLALTGRRHAFRDARRDAILLGRGREAGVVAGCAVSAGPYLVGKVTRSGWRQAAAHTLRDPRFRCRVLLVMGDEVAAFELETRGTEGEDRAEIVLAAPPPLDGWEGALVVSAPSPDGMPEGLVLGRMERRGERCVLTGLGRVSPDDGEAELVVHRPPGSWSDDE